MVRVEAVDKVMHTTTEVVRVQLAAMRLTVQANSRRACRSGIRCAGGLRVHAAQQTAALAPGVLRGAA